MKVSFNEGVLRIDLPKRINTGNAFAFEKELFTINKLNDAKEILLDANNLQFISSLGLRVFFKLAKKFTDKPISIINVSSEVRGILEDTGMDSFIKVYKKMRTVDLTSLELLDVGMYGSVYRINEEQILKIFHDINTENDIRKIIDVIRIAFTHDIPTIIPFEVVTTAKGYGIVLELLNSHLLSLNLHDNTKDFDKYVIKMVNLAKKLAATKLEDALFDNRAEIPQFTEIFTQETLWL